MMSKTEQKILELFFTDLTREYSVMEISTILKLPYAQAHRSIVSLIKKNLVLNTKKGKTSIINLKLTEEYSEYTFIEMQLSERMIKKNREVEQIAEDLEKLFPVQFICVLFGSYAKKTEKKVSDIDLLFIIPAEIDYKIFEKKIRSTIITSKADINITTEQGLLEMWQKPMQLNVGNEILKGHVILRGADSFLRLRRRYYVG